MNKFEKVSGLGKVSLLGEGAGIMKWDPCTGWVARAGARGCPCTEGVPVW